MVQFLKQSTSVTVQIGPAIDISDGVTRLTGLTLTQAKIMLSKNGGTQAQKNSATACTHDRAGWYKCTFNTTDTGTLGFLRLDVDESTAMPIWSDFQIVTANVYDTLFSTDTFDVNVASQANIDFGALQKASLNAATPVVSLSAAGIDAIWDALLAGHNISDSAALALKNSLKIGKNKWSHVGTTFTIYDDNGSSVLYQFTYDDAASPTVRTPV